MAVPPLKIVIVSTPVAPLGAPSTGGLMRRIPNLVKAMAARGHRCTVLAPEGSQSDGIEIVPVKGALQPTALRSLTAGADTPPFYPIVSDAVVARLFEAAAEQARGADAVIAFCYDWLPLYLTRWFSPPLFHVITLQNVDPLIAAAVTETERRFPGRTAMLSRSQAATYDGMERATLVTTGLDMALYPEGSGDGGYLAWAGRISPEKGLDTALDVAKRAGLPLKIAGGVQDAAHWAFLQERYHDTIDYAGYLTNPHDLARLIGGAAAFLQTQRWAEAFGTVTIEALATGTPVIALDRGANAGIVTHGRTGFVVMGDSDPGAPAPVDALTAAVKGVASLSRAACRAYVAQHHSLEAIADMYEGWIMDHIRRGQTA